MRASTGVKMDQHHSDLWQNDLVDNFGLWPSGVESHYADDEFAPGTPPLQNGWGGGGEQLEMVGTVGIWREGRLWG